MAETADVLEALFARCATLAVGSPVLPIAYPEHFDAATQRGFEPPADGRYLEVRAFPNRPAWEGLSKGRLDQGLLQVTVVWPKNQGVLAAVAVADAVKAHFPKSLRLSLRTARVKVYQEPWAAEPLPEGSELRVPVTISWVA